MSGVTAKKIIRGVRSQFYGVKTAVLSAWLNEHFPHAIANVDVGHDDFLGQDYVVVTFTNGHIITDTLVGTRTQEFLAKCTLIYDLPCK